MVLANLKAANQRAKRLQASLPKAVSARYDRRSGRVVIGLSSNIEVGFLPRDAQGLESARPSQLEKIEISPPGFGIRFPRLDADLYLRAILEGALGSQKWMASKRSRRQGGLRTSKNGRDDILPEYNFKGSRSNPYASRYASSNHSIKANERNSTRSSRATRRVHSS